MIKWIILGIKSDQVLYEIMLRLPLKPIIVKAAQSLCKLQTKSALFISHTFSKNERNDLWINYT